MRYKESPLQEAILEFLQDWKLNKNNDGNSPSYADIGNALERSPGTIQRAVMTMAVKGEVVINSRSKICLPNGHYELSD